MQPEQPSGSPPPHPSLEEDAAAIQEAIDDLKKGDRGMPFEEFDRQFRQRHNLPPARPFPWPCPKCRYKEVRRVTIPYPCEWVHDGRAVTVVVPDLSVPRCGNCGELVFDYEAEERCTLKEWLAAGLLQRK